MIRLGRWRIARRVTLKDLDSAMRPGQGCTWCAQHGFPCGSEVHEITKAVRAESR